MGKSTQKQSSNTTVNMEISPDVSTPAEQSQLSTGDLGQLQEILYGAQHRATSDQITALQTQINEQIQTMSNMLNSRLNQLTESMDKTTQAHEHQLNELKTDQLASTKTLTQNMDDNNQQLGLSISTLGKTTNAEAARFQNELKTTETLIQTQLSDMHDSLQLEIKSSADHLQNKKLDRQNLAQLLGDVSEQLNKSDSARSH